ncbi:MAG: aryl-alcohol dehydrogenase-like predicted oxidoreductase [Paraglaciecola sp.]|jgi:aryl-alcohol dehydrogenase-like predicted oxidoreductase
MELKTLGTTDLKVSKICLGTMTFGEQNTEAEGHAQLNYALENGINFIDTAEMYAVPGRAETQGNTERIIGTWLKDRTDREEIILATKITGPSAGIDYLRSPLDFKPASIRTALEGNLKRLQTDYVDLYQLHWPERNANFFGKRGYKHDADEKWEDNFQEVLETIQELIKAGKIHHFGISNETPWGLMRFLNESEKHNLPRCRSIQNPYGLLNRTFEVGLSEIAMRENVGLLAYSPMGFGLLSGKFHKKADKPTDRINKFKKFARYNSQQCWDATTKYIEIAEKHGMTPAQMSLAFVNDRPFVTSNIIGATSLEQLKENIGSAEITLSKEVLVEIEAVQEAIPNPAP